VIDGQIPDPMSREDGGIRVERKPMPAPWDWPLDAPVVLTAPAQAIDWQPAMLLQQRLCQLQNYRGHSGFAFRRGAFAPHP
jgi:hypothetical protein